MTPPLPRDTRLMLRDVNTVGWHAAIVEPDHAHHGWAFSVGFTQTYQHPEIAVFGLPHDVLRAVLDAIAQSLQAGCSYADGQEDVLLAPPYRCVFRGIDEAWRDRLLPDASWFYGARPFPALQLVWPDRSHRLPWDEAFDVGLASFQPLLFHADATAARVTAFLDRDPLRGGAG
ncbi:MAG: DUF4262 domain-containing protein [Nitrospirota bacterium]